MTPTLEPGKSSARMVDRIPEHAQIAQVMAEADAEARRN